MNNKELQKVKELKKQLDEINADEVLTSEVKPFGTSAYINISKKHIGKEAIVIIKKLKEKTKS